ncbi:MAG TPA: InlB B-repeat-containing protein, partial [Vicinamibacterales bacterium]|nr:InlB B-repeat-containing protein [Vicinamibacterales bacterium]
TLGLQATPAAGYTFTGWTGNCAGSTANLFLALTGARTCSATFSPAGTTPSITHQLAITPVPTGGTVTGGGLTCGAGGSACSVTFPAATTVTLTAAPDATHTFTGWGGRCTGTGLTTTVTVDGATTCTATFGGLAAGPPYTMTISPVPTGGTITGAGLNCGTGGSACSVTMPASMTLGLQATPAAGYTFTGWTGDCSGTNASLAINLTGARTCGATFAPMAATYQLSVSQPAGGTVSGGGISCGSGGAACSVTFPAATTVTLTAAPDANYTFTGWGGACSGTSPNTTVTVDGIKSCTAVFAPTVAFGLAITPAPTGGTVTGGGLTCGAGGSACSVTFPAATTVTLTAAPDATHTFTGWGGRCTGTGLTTTVTVDGATTCTATFGGLAAGPPYTMTISPVPTGGTITGAGLNCGTGGSACSVTMPASMTLGLQATPAAGYTFTGWTGNCAGSTANLFLALTGARTCSATFTAR